MNNFLFDSLLIFIIIVALSLSYKNANARVHISLYYQKNIICYTKDNDC